MSIEKVLNQILIDSSQIKNVSMRKGQVWFTRGEALEVAKQSYWKGRGEHLVEVFTERQEELPSFSGDLRPKA